MTLIAQIENRARRDAALFVAEFGEPLDPSETDWDGSAWALASSEIDGADQIENGFELYQSALIAETERLCAE